MGEIVKLRVLEDLARELLLQARAVRLAAQFVLAQPSPVHIDGFFDLVEEAEDILAALRTRIRVHR